MKLLKNSLFAIVFLTQIFFSVPVSAEEIWLQDIPVAKLQSLYSKIGYDGEKEYLMLPSYRYPTVYLKNFPSDYNSIIDEKERNALFIKILTPLALKLNQEILKERSEISAISQKFNRGEELSAADIALIEKQAAKYDIFTRLKDKERYNYLLKELLIRVDQIPPSIMITAAAIETNWGTSRIVKEGNSLYKQLVWHTDKGLKPLGETEDDSYRIKIYPSIYSSMQDYALKINSAPAFKSLRNFRRERRERTSNMSGLILAPYVYGSSNLKNYAGIFDYTLAYYELITIDKSQIDDTMVQQDVIKNFTRYVTKM